MLIVLAATAAIFGVGFGSGFYVRERISQRRRLEAKRRDGFV